MPKLPKILAQPSELISLPERVENYRKAQLGEIDAPYLLPLSCSLIKIESLADVLTAAIWIKRGAGVKMILPDTLPGGFTNQDSGDTIIAQDSLLTEIDKDGWGILDCFKLKIQHGHDIDFSNLRPKGSFCRGGLVASGAESFEKISAAIDSYRYEPSWFALLYLIGTINHVMVQGGMKKGIITTSLSVLSPDLVDYLSVDLGQIPGSLKREVRFPENKEDSLHAWVKLPEETKQLVVDARNFSSLMLAKEKTDPQGHTIYTNVCEGIYLRPNTTCLIVRVPLHRLRLDEIVPAFKAAYRYADALHKYWHKTTDGADLEYPFAPESEDRQIAVDVMGLANLLHFYAVRYEDFVKALEYWVFKKKPTYTKAGEIAKTLWKAYQQTAKIVDRSRYDRVFTVEPAQAHAFRETDLFGLTCARGIWASWDSSVTRVSNHGQTGTFNMPFTDTFQNNPDMPMITKRLNEAWFEMMDNTGLAHAISADTYYKFDQLTIFEWLWESKLPSFYYQFHNELANTRKTVSVDISGLEFIIEDSKSCDPTEGFCQVCGA